MANKTLEVPDLLLSYTYFLDNYHTCHLTIGYDTNDFQSKMVLFKNNRMNVWNMADWTNIYTNGELMDKFFYDTSYDAEFIEMPHCGGNVLFKLSIRNKEKCLIANHNNRKIILFKEECSMLLSLLSYLNSIMTWYNITSVEIKNYYDRYLQICINNNVLKLSPHQFFITSEQSQSCYNSSRIFNEIPILCHKKLRYDLSNYYNNKKNNFTMY